VVDKACTQTFSIITTLVCTYFNNKQIQTSVRSIKYTNDFLTTKYLIKFQIIHLTIDLNVLAHVLDGYDVFVFLSF